MDDPVRESWHFDLRHLRPGQSLELHLQGRQYPLAPHTAATRAAALRANTALGLVDGQRLTHFVEGVGAPGRAVALWYVTAPRLRTDEGLDRIVYTGIHLPRSYRLQGIAARGQGRELEVLRANNRIAASGAEASLGTLTDEQLAEVATFKDALDAAISLVFHHPELMALQPKAADPILATIQTATGLNALAQSILSQSRAHEADPSQPNWVESRPGMNYATGQPSASIYVWSDETLEWLGQPLQDALIRTKDDPTLQGQCWTVQEGVAEVATAPAPPRSPSNEARFATESGFTLKQLTPEAGVVAAFESQGRDGGTFTLTNSYLRWLQVSVDQYGPGGDAVAPMKMLGWVAPVDTIMAIPLPAQPTDFDLTFDPAASRLVVSFGGLGQAPFDEPRDIMGIVLTSIFNLAIPAAFIALGVAVDQIEGWSDIQKKVVGDCASIIEGFTQGPIAQTVAGGASLEDVLASAGNMVPSLVLDLLDSSTDLAVYVAVAEGEGAVQKAIPLFGWIAQVIGAAADIASIVETSLEVASSPATMSVEIVRTMDVQVAVDPDPKDPGHFPESATEYVLTLTYDDGPVYTYQGNLDPTTQPIPIVHTFPSLPAGGKLTVMACFYSKTGWLAGKGLLESVSALPNQGNTLVIPPISIVENLVPLTPDTTYGVKEKLAFRGGKRVWVSGEPPSATEADLSRSPIGKNLGTLTSLGLNEPLSAVGFMYEASGENIPLVNTSDPFSGQMFVYQNVSDTADPESGLKQCAAGYVYAALLAYPPPTSVNPVANGFLLEPGDAERKTMLLRELSLAPGQPFLSSPGQAFGRFTGPQDDLAIHPSGYAVALSRYPYCKLQILKLGRLFADADAPVAKVRAGQGTRRGLLARPVALSCGLSTIFVLQSSPDHPQGSVAAFDLGGNPVSCFSGSPVMALRDEGTSNVAVLDISVESKGYLYVLKYLRPDGATLAASDYRLDIYSPDGSFLTQTRGLSAARLQVDLWRNLYTLTYEMVQGTARTEPSIALWIPSTP
jgi:hypothetical protein